MPNPRLVKFYDISSSRSTLDEIAEDLTPIQLARFKRNIERLEEYGWALNGTFFDNIEGSRLGLREYRLTLDKVDYRVLFSEEPGGVFVMLAAFKEKGRGAP